MNNPNIINIININNINILFSCLLCGNMSHPSFKCPDRCKFCSKLIHHKFACQIPYIQSCDLCESIGHTYLDCKKYKK